MKPERRLQVPVFKGGIAGILLLLTAACVATPDLGSDPLVVTESGGPVAAGSSAERATAIAEMRAKAVASESVPFPDVFQSNQTARLAAREEPRPVAEAEAIELELAALARRRQGGGAPGEIAALEARAADLRRLAAQQQRAIPR